MKATRVQADDDLEQMTGEGLPHQTTSVLGQEAQVWGLGTSEGLQRIRWKEDVSWLQVDCSDHAPRPKDQED